MKTENNGDSFLGNRTILGFITTAIGALAGLVGIFGLVSGGGLFSLIPIVVSMIMISIGNAFDESARNKVLVEELQHELNSLKEELENIKKQDSN